MKLFSSIAAAAVIGASFIAPNPAEAAYCSPYLAYKTMKQVIDGGGTWKQAWQSTGNYHDGTEICTIRIKSFWKKYDGITFN